MTTWSRELLAEKKRLQEYQHQCQVGAFVRFIQVLFSLAFAVSAAVCAFSGQHEWDRVFSAGVALLILWEALAYGFRHWKHLHDDGQKYEELAASLGPRKMTSEAANTAAKQIGLPDLDGGARPLGTLLNGWKWSLKEPSPTKLALIGFSFHVFLFVVLAGTLTAGAFLLAHIVPHFGVVEAHDAPRAGNATGRR